MWAPGGVDVAPVATLNELIDLYMFLKPANSYKENGIKKKIEKCPKKKISYTAETGKRHFKKNLDLKIIWILNKLKIPAPENSKIIILNC